MEAVEKTLTYRDDTGLYRKLLPGDKDKDETDKKGHAETNSDETNYVELDHSVDMKSDGDKTVKVSFTGDGNRLSVIKCGTLRNEDSRIISRDFDGDADPDYGPVSDEPPSETPLLTKLPDTDLDSENEARSEIEELQYTDMYLNSKTESDDGASAVLSDHNESDTVEDESHYITTHEIQLTELDHDVDYDLGRGTCWDFEDDNLVYSFVDYASFESDDAHEGTLIVEGRGRAGAKAQDESDLCDSDKCASSDESVCKPRSGDAKAGQIHLSIQTSSWAVNEPGMSLESDARSLSKLRADRSRFSLESSEPREVPYFIPAPGRQHLATKLRRKDINEYSSGASSSISELDDADKEVRNLTAKSFRSLACPYFDTINLRTSSESSVSEYGLNKWSAYMDFNYGNGGRSVIAHKTSTATVEMNKAAENNSRHAESMISMKASQTRMDALNRRRSSSSSNIELKGFQPPQHGEVTLNFRCQVEPGAEESARRPRGSRSGRSREGGRSRPGMQQQHAGDSVGDTHKRAIFASSLLKNVISKKMQIEQERKRERGDRRNTHPIPSPPFLFRDPERSLSRGLQRQTSESGSGFTVNSADEQGLEGSRPASCEPKEEHKDLCGEPPKGLNRSQGSAFNSWKDGEPEIPKKSEIPPAGCDTQEKEGLDPSMLTKLSQLFVPSSKLLPKEKDCTEASSNHAGPQKCDREVSTGKAGNVGSKEDKEREGKTPEIKICLRSVKENKGCTLNIASLLTPKISYNTVNTFRTAAESKCHFLTATEKIPNFTVRDIRDNNYKCKFQTPIYHVRDVRKLVKSSYRFVSLDNGAKPDDKAKKEPLKHFLPSSIVIKCHSVKTNVKEDNAMTETSQKQQAEAGRSSPKISPETPKHCVTSRVFSKHFNPDQSETHQATMETKLTKQRQERLLGESRSEPGIPKQAALEKLKAAVKTMEQLYVFDRNEWKRRTQAPQPVTHSHVLPLIAREKQGGGEEQGAAAAAAAASSRLTHLDANTDRVHPQFSQSIPPSEVRKTKEHKGSVNIIHVPYNSDTFRTQSQQSKTFSNQSVLRFDNSSKAKVSVNSLSDNIPHPPSTIQSSKSPVAPLSVRIEPSKRAQVDQGKSKSSSVPPAVTHGNVDSENYLTIPGLAYTNEIKLLNPDQVTSSIRPAQRPDQARQQRSPLIMEYPASTIYHHPAAVTPGLQTQLCFSPPVLAVSPTPSAGETVPQTQRKMLLDPTTGHYYLVDTPVRPATKRLFDPETGQYVDVPMPHSPVASVTPITPVSLSVSPLALNPGACAPTYMICPGFVPSPTLPTQPASPQTLCAKDATGEQLKHARYSEQETNTAGAERVYYSATGEAAQAPLQLPVSLGQVTAWGSAANSERKPVISITTQQGPRIIAPPSFDGTTMSFVVEHR
ncbi:uncharacterized protein C4orf54-like [Genypterus blacodes]|uniref:uncharacterized protein C4orf54-like n=1 Tax=Genypterus blacodes TaxID=154954 RepID=UPI003F776A75